MEANPLGQRPLGQALNMNRMMPTTFMLRVSFSSAPECVEVDCWNQAFQTPPYHQDAVIVTVVVIVVTPVLTKGYIGNVFLKIPQHNI